MRESLLLHYQSDLKQIEFIEQADEETLFDYFFFLTLAVFYSDNNLEMIYPTEMYLKNTKAKIFVIHSK